MYKLPRTLKAVPRPQAMLLLLLSLKAFAPGEVTWPRRETGSAASGACGQAFSWPALQNVPGKLEGVGNFSAAQPPGEPERKPERCFSRGQDSQASGTIPQVLPLSTPAQPDPTSLPQGQEAAWRELAADLD